MKPAFSIAAIAVVAVLSACSTRPVAPAAVLDTPARSGHVGAQDITHAGTPKARIALAANEAFHMPLDMTGNPLPAYPEALLAQRLPPRAVCLQVGIGTDGRVMFSQPLHDRPGCAAPVDPAFYAAAEQAVATWRFDPAFKCVFADEATKLRDGPGCSDDMMVAQAVSLAYRFEFRQQDGRGSVEIGQGPVR